MTVHDKICRPEQSQSAAEGAVVEPAYSSQLGERLPRISILRSESSLCPGGNALPGEPL